MAEDPMIGIVDAEKISGMPRSTLRRHLRAELAGTGDGQVRGEIVPSRHNGERVYRFSRAAMVELGLEHERRLAAELAAARARGAAARGAKPTPGA